MKIVDAFRVLLIAQSGFTLGLIVLIIVAYSRVFRSGAGLRRGLLPFHVVTIAIAHSMLILYGVQEVHGRIGDPLTWRTPYLTAAMVISDIALIVVMKIQVDSLKATSTEDKTDTEVVVTMQHHGEVETAVIVPGADGEESALPASDMAAAIDMLRTFRSLLISVLALVLVIGVVTTAVAFQVTRTNRLLDDGVKVRAQLQDQVSVIQDVVCGLEGTAMPTNPTEDCKDN